MKSLYLRPFALGLSLVFPLAAQVSSPPQPIPFIIPQIADGGAWTTTLVLANMDESPASVSLIFFQSSGDGRTRSWNLPFLEAGSTQHLTLPPGGTLFLHTPGTASATTVGWGQVLSYSTVACYAIFTQRVPGRPDQDGTAPAVIGGSHVVVPFDNTGNFVTSIAIANSSPTSVSIISAGFQSTDGSITPLTAIQIPAQGQMAFALPQQFPPTAGNSGLLDLDASSGAISAIALRFNPSGSFTATPVYEDGGPVVIGGSSPARPPFSSLTSVLTFQPAGFPSSQIPLVATPYTAQIGTLAIMSGVASNENRTFTFTAPVVFGQAFLVNGTLLQVTSASLSLTLTYDQAQSNPAYPTGTLNGTLTVSAVPFRGGANVTVSGSIVGNFLMVLL